MMAIASIGETRMQKGHLMMPALAKRYPMIKPSVLSAAEYIEPSVRRDKPYD
jgi:hypothetical protein